MDPTIEHLAKAATIIGDLGSKELVGKSIHREVINVRQVVMWIAHRELGMSSVAIGKFLQRDHATVLYGVRCVQKRIYTNSEETLRLIEKITHGMHLLAKGGTLPPVERLPPPVRANQHIERAEFVAKPLKHWKHYEVCSDEWWRSNDLVFRQGMMKARARVFAEAGE
jgi:hypothetical protein